MPRNTTRVARPLAVIVLVAIALALVAGAASAQESGNGFVDAEATLFEETPDDNGGGYTELCVGNLSTVGETRRAFLRYALPAIPPGSVVTRVVIDFTQNRVRFLGGGPLAATLRLRRVTGGAWVEGTGTGIASGPCGGGGSVAGIDWSNAPAANVVVSGEEALPATAPESIVFDTDLGADDDGLIADVQAWVDGGPNDGWRVEVAEESTADNARSLVPGTLTVVWTAPPTPVPAMDPAALSLLAASLLGLGWRIVRSRP